MEKKLAYYSARYLEKFTNTKSLARLEEQIKKDGKGSLTTTAAAYVYYNKKDKVNPFKHPDLYEYVLEFKRKKDIEDKSNLNHKINHIIIAMSNHKKQIEDAKEKIRKKVKIFLEKNNCSLLLMVQQCNINYPHVYEFVHYGRLGNISLNNAEKLNDFVNKYEEKYNQEF